jgi:TRAP-type C4-dicarboxylate transport system permease small subunit
VEKLRQSLRTGAELIGSFWFLVMFGAFIIQVFTRYVLNHPLGWTTEMCLIGFLWFAFWGGGLMVRERDHVRFDLFYQMAAPKARRIMTFIVTLVLGGVFAYALPANVDYVMFMAHDKTWVMGIRFDLVFAVFIVFLVAVCARNLWRAYRVTRADWHDIL